MEDTLSRLRRVVAESVGLPVTDVSPEDSLESLLSRAPARPVDDEQPSAGANYLSGLTADSLDLVEFLMALEDEFGLELPDGWVEGDSPPLPRADATLAEIAGQIDRWPGGA